MGEISTPVGISFKNETLKVIDAERGFAPRSLWVRRIVEAYYESRTAAGSRNDGRNDRSNAGNPRARPPSRRETHTSSRSPEVFSSE